MKIKKMTAFAAACVVLLFGVWACSEYKGREVAPSPKNDVRVQPVSSSHVPIASLSDFDALVSSGTTVLSILSQSSLDSLRNSLAFNSQGFLASYSYKEINEEFTDNQLLSFYSLFGMTLSNQELADARVAFAATTSSSFSFTDKDGSGKTSSTFFRCKFPDCTLAPTKVCIYANCKL